MMTNGAEEGSVVDAAGGGEAAPEQGKKASKVKEIKKNKLFLRNLSADTTTADLEELFGDVGPIRRCFTINEKGSKRCRGFAIVHFALEEDAQKALKQFHGKTVKGKRMWVEVAKPRPAHNKENRKPKNEEGDEFEVAPVSAVPEAGEAKEVQEEESDEDEGYDIRTGEYISSSSKPSQKQQRESSTHQKEDEANSNAERKNSRVAEAKRLVLVAGLNSATLRSKTKALEKIFGDFGEVSSISYPDANATLPILRVNFVNANAAQKAVSRLNGKPLLGADKVHAVLKKQSTTSRLIIRNLSFQSNENDIKTKFSPFGTLVDLALPRKPDGKIKGFAFVEYTNADEATNAIQNMNAKRIRGRPVAVDWAVSKNSYLKHLEKEEKEEEEEEEDEEEEEEEEEEQEEEEEEEEEETKMEEESDDEEENEEDDEGEEEEEDEDEEDDMIAESDEEDEEDNDDEAQSKVPKQKPADDLNCALFIRNLSFDTTEATLKQKFSEYGKVKFCRIVRNKATGGSRGTAFVHFVDKASADIVLKEVELFQKQLQLTSSSAQATNKKKAMESAATVLSAANKSGIYVDGRELIINRAVNKQTATELTTANVQKKQEKDKRNLWLANEGVITADSEAAQGLSKAEIERRERAYQEKKQKLKNPNIFVSTTRLSVRQLPKKVDEQQLKQIFREAAATAEGQDAHKLPAIKQAKIVRDEQSGVSKGYGFVEFYKHEHALAALRQVNNNPQYFGEQRRPLVEFALENMRRVHEREQRLKRQKEFNKQKQHEKGGEEEEGEGARKQQRGKKKQNPKNNNDAENNDDVDESASKSTTSAKSENDANLTPRQKKRLRERRKKEARKQKRMEERENKKKNQQQKNEEATRTNASSKKRKTRSSEADDVQPVKVAAAAKKSNKEPQKKKQKTTPKPQEDDSMPQRRAGSRRHNKKYEKEQKLDQLVSQYKQKLFGNKSTAPTATASSKIAQKKQRWFE